MKISIVWNECRKSEWYDDGTSICVLIKYNSLLDDLNKNFTFRVSFTHVYVNSFLKENDSMTHS